MLQQAPLSAAEFVARGPADGYQLALLGAGHAGGVAYATERYAWPAIAHRIRGVYEEAVR